MLTILLVVLLIILLGGGGGYYAPTAGMAARDWAGCSVWSLSS